MKNDNLIKYNAKRQLDLLDRQRAEKLSLFNELDVQIELEVANRLKERIEQIQDDEGSVSRDRRLLEEKIIKDEVKKEYKRKENALNREMNYDFRKEKHDLRYNMQREKLMDKAGYYQETDYDDYDDDEYEEGESLWSAVKLFGLALLGVALSTM